MSMDTEQVTKSQFKARALELFRKIEESGSTVVVTDHGRPIVEVRRYRRNQRSPLEVLRNSVVDFKRPTEPI
jgi:antitoxin (DNA-binding transcriptional repressor) of toxin-antitoxin stability system|tara:strand:+ start:228 stop:443 length:216 start_codon:yes stop_codon:yes gene_type:complete